MVIKDKNYLIVEDKKNQNIIKISLASQGLSGFKDSRVQGFKGSSKKNDRNPDTQI